MLAAFTAQDGGMLSGLDTSTGKLEWQDILDRWEGHEEGEIMQQAIEMLCSSRLSFRGFIQPRVRKCLDVLDAESPEAADFGFKAGDSAEQMKEKLEVAWQNASYNSRCTIQEMAKEPPMARFAVAQDFRDAVLRTGGESHSKELWRRFYNENRGNIWPEQFQKLEGDTRLRKEWEDAVGRLRGIATTLADSVTPAVARTKEK